MNDTIAALSQAFRLCRAIGDDPKASRITERKLFMPLPLAVFTASAGYDSRAFLITGATPTPEPASLVLAGMGVTLIGRWQSGESE